jgi:brefeldin A-resistance guanine nucleotide exchange factor 1
MASSSSLGIAVDPIALAITDRKHCPHSLSLDRTPLKKVDTIRVQHLNESAFYGGTPFASGPSPFSEEDNDKHDVGKWCRTHGIKCQNIQPKKSSLITLFDQLQTELKQSKDIRAFDSPMLLYPFLQVLRSSAPVAITTLALLALTKIFFYKIVVDDSPGISMAMERPSSTITQCRSQASDSGSSGTALLRVLMLMEDITTGPVGQLRGDTNIHIKAGLRICGQVHVLGVLRTSAKNTLTDVCQTIFLRLPVLDVFSLPARQDSLSLTYLTTLPQSLAIASEAATCADQKQSRLSPPPKPIRDANAFAKPLNHDGGHPGEAKPYSLNAIKEIFRVPINLLDPYHQPRTDQTMVVLKLINTASEIAGSHTIRHAGLACLVQNELCHHLFQLIRSKNENLVLVTRALRVTTTLFRTCHPALKVQQEHHLTYLVACIRASADIPGDTYQQMGQNIPQRYHGLCRISADTVLVLQMTIEKTLNSIVVHPRPEDMMIEGLCVLVGIPSFMVEVFINYDSDVGQSGLCEDITRTLCWGVLPSTIHQQYV